MANDRTANDHGGMDPVVFEYRCGHTAAGAVFPRYKSRLLALARMRACDHCRARDHRKANGIPDPEHLRGTEFDAGVR